jgi:hypothetical protein
VIYDHHISIGQAGHLSRGLAITRAKSASQENIDNYFQELEKIIVKYNLSDEFHCNFKTPLSILINKCILL